MVKKPYPHRKPESEGWYVCGLADRARDRNHPKPEIHWWSKDREAFVTGSTKVNGVVWWCEV